MSQALRTTVLNTVFDEDSVLKQELLEGLLAEKKYINSKFFYDEAGSQLFEKIMQLPEYYPSRTEITLLEKHQNEIAVAVGENKVLIEPGAGNCEKVQYILPTLQPKCYVPIDISADFLFESASNLQTKFPHVHIHAVADDMKAKVDVPEAFKANHKVVFYPGSTIGNYKPSQALDFLKHVRELVGEQGGLLIGVDLQKDKEILEVKLISVPANSDLGQIKGADAIFEVYTESYGEKPIVIQGAGAGASVTARGVFGDILRLAQKN